MSRRDNFRLGELPERKERRFQGVGYSHGEPNKPPEQPSEVTQVTNGTTQSFPVTTNSVKLLAANRRRNYLFFQNNGTDTIFIGVGTQVAGDNGNAIVLAAGAMFEPNNGGGRAFWNDVYVKAASGVQNLVYMEGVDTGV